MTEQQEAALRLALEALEHMCMHTRAKVGYRNKLIGEAMDKAREALAEQQSGIKQVIELYDSPEQPAQQETDKYLLEVECTKCGATEKGVLTFTPQSKPWVGLTDEEIAQGNKESWVTEQAWQSAVWWAEAKLKEKNT